MKFSQAIRDRNPDLSNVRDGAVPSDRPGKDRRQERGPGLPLTCVSCGAVLEPVTEGRLRKHQDEHPDHSRFEWSPSGGRLRRRQGTSR